MSRRKTKSFHLLLIGIIASVSVLLFLVRLDIKKSQQNQSEPKIEKATLASNSEAKKTEAKSPEEKKKLLAMLRNLARQNQTIDEASPSNSVNDFIGDNPAFQMTEEEKNLAIAQQEALSKIYWDKAPNELEEMLNEEEPDIAWEGEVRAAAENLLSSKYEGSHLYDVNCGSTLCKMVIDHDDPSMYSRFAETNFAEEPPWATNKMGGITELPNGKTGNYFYFAKNGYNDRFLDLDRRLLKKYTDVPLASELASLSSPE